VTAFQCAGDSFLDRVESDDPETYTILVVEEASVQQTVTAIRLSQVQVPALGGRSVRPAVLAPCSTAAWRPLLGNAEARRLTSAKPGGGSEDGTLLPWPPPDPSCEGQPGDVHDRGGEETA
jgi:hypothetical protein